MRELTQGPGAISRILGTPLRIDLPETAAPSDSSARAPRSIGAVKAVVLAGGPGTATFKLADRYPKLAFPMADGRPLLVHLLRTLTDLGVTDVALLLSKPAVGNERLLDLLQQHVDPELSVSTFFDNGLRGTAGALKHLTSFIGSSRFLVVNSNLWLDGLDLRAVIEQHRRSDAIATVVVEEVRSADPDLGYLSVTDGGDIESVKVPHRSQITGHPMRVTGVYLFEPSVINAIDAQGYADIKEQLLPRLAEAGGRVQTYLLEHSVPRINDLCGYRNLNRSLLRDLVEASGHEASEYFGGVCVGRGSTVSPNAYILGPVMIGDDCVIEDGAQIIGPTVICDRTSIGPRVLVRESFIWPGCTVMTRAKIIHSLITESCTIAENELIDNAVIVAGERHRGETESDGSSNGSSNGHGASVRTLARRPARRRRQLHRMGYRCSKRSLDLSSSAAGLLLLAPLFLVIAALIKLDSRGPVYFRQRRCGRDGRPFTMIKFRTMSADAETRKSDLTAQNEVAGPMFKMKNDPRVTRIGNAAAPDQPRRAPAAVERAEGRDEPGRTPPAGDGGDELVPEVA